ncbi:LysR family transcriptional regulator [Telmatospirillum siberiense]|uniref:LysR family transcriptional regulator n=1 Tax=Telmatospirillum siberiense TaxID=382514 RepID=A0A2N3PUG0_9PROT|nr:LysR family transcriptional regulator [Telmatospirillum siberiense]PKU24043.1 LysR family transcriptional regulator [Telmatospirillum siberiense]
MPREIVGDLRVFLAVARERNFTRAAAQIGMSQSALSHAIRELEERLGVRLLTRTTRSVSLTQAGERVLQAVGPRLGEIDTALAALRESREKPAGTVRITATEHAIDSVIWPKLAKVMWEYPEIKVEFVIDYGLTDIVKERYDAGVRYGEYVAKDMIAVRIGPDTRVAVVAAPSYFAKRSRPQTPHDLAAHDCINLRTPTHGGLFAWEFEKEGRELNVHVEGRFIFNGMYQVVNAALDGYGIAYMEEEFALAHIADGRLVRVLEDWCPPFTGYHLYYPSRRQASTAFTVVAEALRYRG